MNTPENKLWRSIGLLGGRPSKGNHQKLFSYINAKPVPNLFVKMIS